MKRPECTIAVVAGEPTWPPTHGGRARTAAIIAELSEAFNVVAIRPGPEPPDPDCPWPEVLIPPPAPGGAVQFFFSPRPRIGLRLLGQDAGREIRNALIDANVQVVLFAHSYLAAVAHVEGLKVVVDFANIESQRFRSLARNGKWKNRAAWLWEAVKALRWERAVAESADLCLATSAPEAEQLEKMGAHVIPYSNPLTPILDGPSAPRAPITFIASHSYPPNQAAGFRIVDSIWPLVLKKLPDATLRIVGRDAEQFFGHYRRRGVEVHGDVEDVDKYFHEASVLLAPVETGGGRQLKVTDAIRHGRLAVVSPHSSQSVPSELLPYCRVCGSDESFADAIVELHADPNLRNRLESEISGSLMNVMSDDSNEQSLGECVRNLIKP